MGTAWLLQLTRAGEMADAACCGSSFSQGSCLADSSSASLSCKQQQRRQQHQHQCQARGLSANYKLL
jgi:hypothetical protein